MASILAVDFGSVRTRVVLIDVVDGAYRLVARADGRTTDGFPVYDLEVGLNRVLRDLSRLTGRKLMEETGQIITPERPDRSGVDIFAVTASIGRPVRAVIVGLVPDVSIASAIRASNGTYIDEVATISLDDGRTEEERLNTLLLSNPDIIYLTGGTENGAENAVLRFAELIRLAVTLIKPENRRPSIIYTGNSALVEAIKAKFDGLTTVFIGENVRPSIETEHLENARLQLANAFDRYKENRHRSFAVLSEMSQTGIMPTAQGYTLIADYLGKITQAGVAVVDIGSASSTLAVSFGQDVVSAIRTDVGLGHSAPQLLNTIGADAVRYWLPMYISEDELQNYVLNKSLRPATIPMTLRELYIEHGLLRAGIRRMLVDANPTWEHQPLALTHIIMAGAALTGTGSPGYDALLILDALQPTGVTTLHADPYGLVSAMGAIATQEPSAVVQLLDNDSLSVIGTAISLTGRPRLDKPVAKIKIIPEDDEGDVVEDVILGGHLWTYHLAGHQSAKVTIRCRGGMRINGKRKLQITLRGGSLGIIVDARGRPLMTGHNVHERAALFPVWIHEVTGDELRDVDPTWLEKPPEKSTSKPTNEKKPRRRNRRRKQQEESADDVLDQRLMMDKSPEATETEEDDLGALRNVLS
ncbi:MAG: glutamate mutase L [Phototrophicales bacterium]